MTPVDEIEFLMEVQANLQVGLGILRLEIGMLPKDGIQQNNLGYSEDRLAKALAQCHQQLDALGIFMANPATHPEVWEGPE